MRRAPESYLTKTEYHGLLTKIQSAVFRSLEENDMRFGGDDGISAVFVYGSVGKSWFTEGETTLVRKPAGRNPGSDLDIFTIGTSIRNRKRLSTLTDEDLDLGAELNLLLDYPDLIRFPTFQLTARIKRDLRESGLLMPVAFPGVHLALSTPIEKILATLEKPSRDFRGYEAGLLFVPESETRRDLIFGIFRQSQLKVVVNPATIAQVL